jgi:hypothetical protein
MYYRLLLLPISFLLFGYLVTTKKIVYFLNTLDPIKGFSLYYLIVSISILLLVKLGLVVADIHFTSWNHFIGILLLNFAFFIVIIWTNCYVAEIVKGGCKNFTRVYLNTESGATYYFWSQFVKNRQLKRLLSFVITPFILSLIGLILIKQ